MAGVRRIKMNTPKEKFNHLAVIAGVVAYVVIYVAGTAIVNSMSTPLPLHELKEKENEIMKEMSIYGSIVVLFSFFISGFVAEMVAGIKGVLYGSVVGVTNIVASLLFLVAMVGLSKVAEVLTHILTFGTIISLMTAVFGGIVAEKWLSLKK